MDEKPMSNVIPYRRYFRCPCGMSHKTMPEYQSWKHARHRCTNPNYDGYAFYGAKGITMCERWLESFHAFLDDMGPRPAGTSLDRIDNNRGYEPGNCRWATASQQVRNRTTAPKLTDAAAAAIRTSAAAGVGSRRLAKEHGVSRNAIKKVIRGTMWKAP
jgi:hypothetical protein